MAMGWVFARYATALAIKRTTAIAVWVLGMNGFLVGLVGLMAWRERII